METTQSDFFSNHFGSSPALGSKPALVWRARDWWHDLGLRMSREIKRRRKQLADAPPRNILIVGIEVPTRAPDIHSVVRKLMDGSRHRVSTSVVRMGDSGKFENIDRAIAAAAPLKEFDWLIVSDDDINFSVSFLDDLIMLAEASGLSLLQPAHAFESHSSYWLTRRRWGSLVRQTNFVEIGPLTLIKSDIFSKLIPFPNSRWCYGIDLVWSEVLRRNGHKLGIVDGAPVKHLRPVGMSYNMDLAIEEGQKLLRQFDVRTSRTGFLSGDQIIIRTR